MRTGRPTGRSSWCAGSRGAHPRAICRALAERPSSRSRLLMYRADAHEPHTLSVPAVSARRRCRRSQTPSSQQSAPGPPTRKRSLSSSSAPPPPRAMRQAPHLLCSPPAPPPEAHTRLLLTTLPPPQALAAIAEKDAEIQRLSDGAAETARVRAAFDELSATHENQMARSPAQTRSLRSQLSRPFISALTALFPVAQAEARRVEHALRETVRDVKQERVALLDAQIKQDELARANPIAPRRRRLDLSPPPLAPALVDNRQRSSYSAASSDLSSFYCGMSPDRRAPRPLRGPRGRPGARARGGAGGAARAGGCAEAAAPGPRRCVRSEAQARWCSAALCRPRSLAPL